MGAGHAGERQRWRSSEGDQTAFLEDFGSSYPAFVRERHCRVQAEGGDVFSGRAWSEVVEA